MTVIDVQQDLENHQLVMTSQLDAPVERVWQVWSDPRQLERWWGPPSYPATVTTHEFTPGGQVRYYMTSPEGETFHGWWEVQSVDAPHALEFKDGFGDQNGNPTDQLPTSVTRVELTAHEGGTRMVSVSRFETAEAFQQVLEMGMAEGSKQAGDQIDALLAA